MVATGVTGWLLSPLLHSPLWAQEWTRFRGPDGSGAGAGATAPTRITPEEYNWRVALPGVGHSCPVLWGKSIFLTSAEAKTGKRHLLCLDAATGKRKWTKSFDFTAYHHHEYNNAASSTPTVDAKHVYAIWSTPDSFVVHALDHAGNPVWKRDLGAYPTSHGGASSPMVVGDTLVVTKEPDGAMGCLVGLDCNTPLLPTQLRCFTARSKVHRN
jgi:outer membrane protein assembly factor BamB